MSQNIIDLDESLAVLRDAVVDGTPPPSGETLNEILAGMVHPLVTAAHSVRMAKEGYKMGKKGMSHKEAKAARKKKYGKLRRVGSFMLSGIPGLAAHAAGRAVGKYVHDKGKRTKKPHGGKK